MKLEHKKSLAARALKVGKNRIVFNKNRLDEIKEAITKQDIKELYKNGAIFIKEIKGRRKIKKRLNRRRAGSIKKRAIDTKKRYVIITRKLRQYLRFLKKQGKISRENYKKLRVEIRNSNFKSLASLKERIRELENA